MTPTDRLIDWARKQAMMAGNGHIDENERFKLRDLMVEIGKDRPYPDLLTTDEQMELLVRAERLWSELAANNLGGFSGINRPFWILGYLKDAVEDFGRRDVGRHWSKLQLDAAKPKKKVCSEDGCHRTDDCGPFCRNRN
jgi:hypothetical protein